MNTLDELLRNAKPSVPEMPVDFSQHILNRIEEEGIRIQPAPSVRPARLFFGAGITALLISLILFNYNSYELRMNGSLELLFFGGQFLKDFIRFLPWDLIVSSLVLSIVSAILIWRSGIVQIGITGLTLVSFIFSGVGGTTLAAAGINEAIETRITSQKSQMPWLAMFQNHRAQVFIHHPNFKLGRVKSMTNGKALILTPHGDTITIQVPHSIQIQTGQILRLSGQVVEAEFEAQTIQLCNPTRVNRYFEHMTHHRQHHPMMMKRPCCQAPN